MLSPKVAELVKQGKGLGEADDIVFGKTNSKQSNGGVGILTGDVLTRTPYYEPTVILALIPFRKIHYIEGLIASFPEAICRGFPVYRQEQSLSGLPKKNLVDNPICNALETNMQDRYCLYFFEVPRRPGD